MFYSQTTTRMVWDIYAEIAAAGFTRDGKGWNPTQLAERTAEFADEMCRQRAVRIPTEDKKTK